MAGKEKARLLGGLLSIRLLVLPTSAVDLLVEVFAPKLVADEHPDFLAVRLAARHLLKLSIAAHQLCNVHKSFGFHVFRRHRTFNVVGVSVNYYLAGHRFASFASGLFLSYISSINQNFRIVNRQFGEMVKFA